MKMCTVALRPPWRASTCSPKARAPLPMSQTKYSSDPVTSSTHEVWPPNVWLSANGSSRLTKSCASPNDSKRRPDAATSACASRSRMSATVSPTGIEPRVPQNRTRIARSALVKGLQRCGRNRGERFARGGGYLQHEVEAADLQDLRDHRLRRRHHDAVLVRIRLARAHHQAAQAGARDVLEA